MARLWVSPTEPAELRERADVVSMHPETFGVDILVHGLAHSVGVQRKTISDLIASLQDGRLAEQVMKMGRLNVAIVLLEGKFNWTHDGHLVSNGWGERLTEVAFKKIKLSVLASGVHIDHSTGLHDTLKWIESAMTWCDNSEHSTLQPKGRDVRGAWGDRAVEHYRLGVLSSFPGIGPELARRILDEVGWPFEISVDLSSVKGLGKKRLASIREVFDE